MYKFFKILSFSVLITGLVLLTMTGCEKDEEPVPVQLETDSIADIDGNIYTVVKIGNQWWMAENLMVSRYRDGDVIVHAQSDTSVWNNNLSGAYCVYQESSTAPGFLYNWYAVNNSKNIAPQGWHIPTDAEWKELEKYLGMTQDEADKPGWRGTREGEKLKIEGTQGWLGYDGVWPTNESGFTALAGSCRLFNGVWGNPGLFNTGFWWSADEQSSADAWYRHLDYKNADVFRQHTFKNYGMSIRCVKD